MLTTKQQSKWICLITAVLLSFGAAGCSRFQSGEIPEESDDHVEETLPKETIPDETNQPDTSGYLTIPEISLSKVEALPYPEDTALFSAAPIGGEPVVYFFDNNLTFYIQTYLYSETEAAKEYYTGTLTLPDGITDGTVIYASRGGGSGEVDIIVKAANGNEQVYLDYYFNYNNENYLPGSVVVLDDLQVQHLMETIAFTENKSDITPEKNLVTLPDNFIFPITDGSTSTTNLDKAIRSAILGGDQTVAHTKTYTSFRNLLDGKCELIFTTPLSASQLQDMEREGFRHEAEPVAGEGFVFVVNKDNPVDTLTIELIKGIYSGEITNWKEVGGNDAEIIAYQRNADSGSQNYMISFMGATPLMKPVTDQIPASMSGILDVIANYDNGIDAIGYSVYAYSDGMYENISEIKYIKVNGVEPSLNTLADGTYPLLGYNYAVFSADEPDDSSVRALVKWIQSDEGQQVIANAGYIPYRQVDGLTLPEATAKTLYNAAGTSGIEMPEKMADYYYRCNQVPESFSAAGLDEKIQTFISESTAVLSQINEEEAKAFIKSRAPYGYGPEIVTRKTLTNGYLSVLVGLRYNFGAQDSPDHYYDSRAAVFDIYTGEQLELSDLFFEGENFVPVLNKHLADEASAPYSSFGATHDMLRDFTGLYEGEFVFTADSIIFKPGTCFADGVELSIADLSEYMVTSIPRDMSGYLNMAIPVYKSIRIYHSSMIGYAEMQDDQTIWYLDQEKAPVAAEVCDRVNGFINDLYDTYFTEEKLLAAAQKIDAAFDKVSVGPWPDFHVYLCGERYIELSGANTSFPQKSGESCDITFNVIEEQYNPYYFHFYFNAHTGEELRIGDLFTEGWDDNAQIYLVDENYSEWDNSTWKEYAGEIDPENCRILSIKDYQSVPYNRGDLSDLEIPAVVYVADGGGGIAAVSVPREYIK